MSAKQEFLDRVQRWLIVDAISIRNIKQNRRSWKLRCKIRAEAWLLQMIRSFIIQQQLRISEVRSISGIWVQICCSLATCNTNHTEEESLWYPLCGGRDWLETRCDTGLRSRALTNDSRDPPSEAGSPLIDTTCHVSRSVISSYIYHPPVHCGNLGRPHRLKNSLISDRWNRSLRLHFWLV